MFALFVVCPSRRSSRPFGSPVMATSATSAKPRVASFANNARLRHAWQSLFLSNVLVVVRYVRRFRWQSLKQANQTGDWDSANEGKPSRSGTTIIAGVAKPRYAELS